MSKIKNGRLDQYGAEPCEQQQFGTANVEGVNPFTADPVKALYFGNTGLTHHL